MGHAMHGLLSNVTYRSLSGTSVMWDFVELPSQVQENWCFEKEALDIFASHYQTGEKIPAELIDKLVASKNYMVGWAGLRQVCFSTLDMAWYSQDPSGISDVAAFEDAETAETTLFPRMAGPFSTSFSHIFAGGYSAGYYSYKWAEVLDADTFELFLERGLYDQETARRYRVEILEKGGSEHPKILYRNFRGRDADPEALIRREGLGTGKAA
jgi:peptidyl-dipeptidase Dcp